MPPPTPDPATGQKHWNSPTSTLDVVHFLKHFYCTGNFCSLCKMWTLLNKEGGFPSQFSPFSENTTSTNHLSIIEFHYPLSKVHIALNYVACSFNQNQRPLWRAISMSIYMTLWSSKQYLWDFDYSQKHITNQCLQGILRFRVNAECEMRMNSKESGNP